MNIKIIAAHIDGWVALYGIDGQCICQKHSLDSSDIYYYLKTVEAHPRDINLIDKWYDHLGSVNDYVTNCMRLPETLAELIALESCDISAVPLTDDVPYDASVSSHPILRVRYLAARYNRQQIAVLIKEHLQSNIDHQFWLQVKSIFEE